MKLLKFTQQPKAVTHFLGIDPTTGSSDASTSETSESEAPDEEEEDDEVWAIRKLLKTQKNFYWISDCLIPAFSVIIINLPRLLLRIDLCLFQLLQRRQNKRKKTNLIVTLKYTRHFQRFLNTPLHNFRNVTSLIISRIC